jgi:amidase
LTLSWIGFDNVSESVSDEAFEKVRRYVAFTPRQNIRGAPAISLSLGFSSNGLPLGVQFGAAFGHEKGAS